MGAPPDLQGLRAQRAGDLRGEGHDKERAWAFWEHTGDPAAKEEGTPWLFPAPATVASLNGDPVERVGFVRDEGANLAWGVESTIEGPLGNAPKRRSLWGLAQAGFEEAEAEAGGGGGGGA